MPPVMDVQNFLTLVDASYSMVVQEEEADVTDIISQLFSISDGDRLDEFTSMAPGTSSRG